MALDQCENPTLQLQDRLQRVCAPGCRSEGAIGDVQKAAEALRLEEDEDCVVATALAALLLSFARHPADQAVLATPAAMRLLRRLLRVGAFLEIQINKTFFCLLIWSCAESTAH